MNANLKEKIKNLPKTPGVYLYRNKEGRVIYVGKAVNLKARVSSYFTGIPDSLKTEQLIKNIASLEHLTVESEVQALLLESELVKRYKPKYNIELKDDKNYLFLKIPKEDFPLPEFVRSPNEEGEFIGPFTDARTVREMLKILRRVYPYRSKGDLKAKKACFYYHLGQCPGVCINVISRKDYAKNIRRIKNYFEGKGGKLEKELAMEMKKLAKEEHYEEAAQRRDKIYLLKKIKTLHIKDYHDIGSKEDKALIELETRLSLKEPPRRIECFDISNIQGVNAVGSMVVFLNGVAARKEYRKFKIRGVKGANDPAMMGEVVYRRVKSIEHREKSEKPDLIVIDGGKGQLSAVREVLVEAGVDIPMIGLAKKEEEIYFIKQLTINNKQSFGKIVLPRESEALYLLQRVRDEAHRFAITYFRGIHREQSKKSVLDEIPGIGPKTKKKILRHFGSVKKLKEAEEQEVEVVLGEKLARIIKERL